MRRVLAIAARVVTRMWPSSLGGSPRVGPRSDAPAWLNRCVDDLQRNGCLHYTEYPSRVELEKLCHMLKHEDRLAEDGSMRRRQADSDE